MKKFIFKFALFVTFFGCRFLNSQTPALDSLKIALKASRNDSITCMLLNNIVDLETNGKWQAFNTQLCSIAEKNIAGYNFPQKKYYYKLYAKSVYNKGDEATLLEKPELALEYYQRSVKIREQMNDKEAVADGYNAIGIMYDDLGDINKALEFYHKSLKIYREIKDYDGVATALNNLGYVYDLQGEREKALEAHTESLKISETIGDKKGMASSLHNIGLYYDNSGDIRKAFEFYNRSIKVSEANGVKHALISSLCNVAKIYARFGDPDCKDEHNACLVQGRKKGLEISMQVIKVAEEIKDLHGLSMGNDNMANIKLLQGKYAEALQYGLKCMDLAKQLKYPENIRAAALGLKRIYEKQNKFEDALRMYELSVQMSDSINNEQTRKASIKKQFQIEYELESAKDSIATQAKITEEKLRNEQAIQQQRVYTYAGIAGLCVMIIVAGLSFRAYQTKKKANGIISAQKQFVEEQKHIIEEKHKEITDSINYAERIQRSFLATKELLDENLEEYFVLFKPKDVVSGDFYWAESAHSHFYLATADSTGHGVPGAIMSLLNITSLERAIESCREPDQILNHTRKTIINRLKRDGSAEGGKDGMDCSLLCFDSTKKILTVAAAHNPVWIIRTSNDVKEVIEIKGDKMPVGKHDNDQRSFTLHTMQLQKGDVIYTLTDGFPDQFGGESGKKFMSKRLKELLQSISHHGLSEQKKILEETFDKWIRDLEQIDDVTVIGIKV